MSITETAPLLAAGRLSPVELTEAYLERIERWNGRLAAYISVQAGEALAGARQAEAEIQAGLYRGPLHGMPIAIKDNVAVAGRPMTAGSKILAGHVARDDATVVRRLRQAGAVILGKLNLHEFAYGATSENPFYGASVNPWSWEHMSGGSSGGAAVAVGAGLCAAAMGTDTAGSVRIPAAACGVVGFKPTFGSISRAGVFPLAGSLDHVGPLARTVADTALLLAAVEGYDPLDPGTLGVGRRRGAGALGSDAWPGRWRPGLGDGGLFPWPGPSPDREAPLTGLRVGIPQNFFLELCDSENKAAFQRAVDVLVELGVSPVPVAVPMVEEAYKQLVFIISREAVHWHRRWFLTRPGDYGRDVRERLSWAQGVTAATYGKAQEWRRSFLAALEAVLRRCPVLVAPALPVMPPPLGTRELDLGGRPVDATIALSTFTGPFNLAGLPSIVVPAGFAPDTGLPVGIAFTAAAGADWSLLRVAAAYEAATPRQRRSPELP